MIEGEHNFMPEAEPRPETYSLDRTTIEALTEVRRMPGKMGELPWPLELQGKGTTDEQDKTLLVRFPKGDVFLSFATTIHELGHLRQEELNPTLKADEQTHSTLLAQEADAWTRGWERFSKANPDVLSSLEGKFQTYRAQGKLNNSSFQELYGWIQQNVLRMVETQRILFEESGEADVVKMDRLAEGLEKSGIRDFLVQYQGARVGEVIDEEEARKAIQKTVELAIGE